MEAIVRAATELGVTRFRPALCERTIVRLELARWRDRARRWQRVAREAAKQSGRAIVPEVELPRPLAECLDTARGSRAVPLGRRRRAARHDLLAGAGDGPLADGRRGARGGARPRRGRGRAGRRIDDRLSRSPHLPDRDGRAGDRGDPPVPAWRPPMTQGGWEQFEVEADVGVRGWGPSRGGRRRSAHPGRLLAHRGASHRGGPGATRGACPGRGARGAAGDLDQTSASTCTKSRASWSTTSR